MKIAIVGSDSRRWTPEGERQARDLIRFILGVTGVTEVISGACHLGGIDLWAAEIGRELGLKVTEFAAKVRAWNGHSGFKARNQRIVDACDVAHCLAPNRLPDGSAEFCFHCGTGAHSRSGGCWVAKHARLAGKLAVVHVIEQA